jgi:hypothetical protein
MKRKLGQLMANAMNTTRIGGMIPAIIGGRKRKLLTVLGAKRMERRMAELIKPAKDITHWWGRVILASRGRETPFGAMVLAILGYEKGLPAWGRTCDILANGLVVSEFTGEDGRTTAPLRVKVCTLDELKKFVYDLAEATHMTDSECEEWYNAVRSWVRHDQSPGERLDIWLRGEENRRKLKAGGVIARNE